MSSLTIPGSQLESITSVLLGRVERYRAILMNNEVLPFTKLSKATYITGAIVLYVVVKVYSIFAYPSNLKHIKRMSVLTWLSSLIKGETAIQRTQRLLVPMWEESNGLIAIYDQSGWTINVSNPEAVKTILYKTGTNIFDRAAFVTTETIYHFPTLQIYFQRVAALKEQKTERFFVDSLVK